MADDPIKAVEHFIDEICTCDVPIATGEAWGKVKALALLGRGLNIVQRQAFAEGVDWERGKLMTTNKRSADAVEAAALLFPGEPEQPAGEQEWKPHYNQWPPKPRAGEGGGACLNLLEQLEAWVEARPGVGVTIRKQEHGWRCELWMWAHFSYGTGRSSRTCEQAIRAALAEAIETEALDGSAT